VEILSKQMNSENPSRRTRNENLRSLRLGTKTRIFSLGREVGISDTWLFLRLETKSLKNGILGNFLLPDSSAGNLMVWSAADPTVQLGYKGHTEEECHGAIHTGY
jgi:hypothetical protein